MTVVDASVVLKWFLPGETGAPEALELRARHVSDEHPVAAPDLLFYEVANTLAITSRLQPEEADAAWQSLLAVGVLVHAPDDVLVLRAMDLARDAAITAYDASYIALAERLGCDLVTADLKLIRKTRNVELACTVRPLVEEKP